MVAKLQKQINENLYRDNFEFLQNKVINLLRMFANFNVKEFVDNNLNKISDYSSHVVKYKLKNKKNITIGYRFDYCEYIEYIRKIKNVPLPADEEMQHKLLIIPKGGAFTVDFQKYMIKDDVAEIKSYSWLVTSYDAVCCKLIDATVSSKILSFSFIENARAKYLMLFCNDLIAEALQTIEKKIRSLL
jgi:hypothetical protein